MKVNLPDGFSDQDILFFVREFEKLNLPLDSVIMEIGANEEDTADLLIESGYPDVIGVDLRLKQPEPRHHLQLLGNFVTLVTKGKFLHNHFDLVFSTSAIEHFGLGSYGEKEKDHDLDCKSIDAAFQVLKSGGYFINTVPYGKNFVTAKDWRIYNAEHLHRMIRSFNLVHKEFFLSANAPGIFGDTGSVTQEQADNYEFPPPHVTVGLVLRKP
jgi:hypothetical protein